MWQKLAPLLLLLLLSAAEATQVQHGGLTVVYTDTRDKRQLGAVFRAWDAAARDLRALGLPPPAQVRIEAASSAADFARRTGEGSNIAAVTHGATIYTQRLTALSLAGRLPITLRHEAFHTAQPVGIPRWLAEGLARTFSGEAKADPRAPTGLGGLSDRDLDARLLSRDPAHLNAAYREAARRAGRVRLGCLRSTGKRVARLASALPVRSGLLPHHPNSFRYSPYPSCSSFSSGTNRSAAELMQ